MCGVAGIFAYNNSAPPVDQEELLRIREAMVRRGPDGAGLWISPDRHVGLAHRRLAIIDLSDTGAQPMASADDLFRITFNGEIYNYRELRKELEAKGYRFRSASDTEILLHLYADRGEDMVHALRGMYAFALWDERKRGLFLARDPFGIKPLYYSDNGKSLRFASQVKALLRGGGIASHPEAAGYVGFLIWGCVPEPFTLHREIRALPAGTHMWIDAGGKRGPAAFFSAGEEYAKAEAASAPSTNGDDAQQARCILRDSVRHHLIADVPVAAFLSAGLDSGTLVTLAAERTAASLRTLTLGFSEYQGSENDETGLAQSVAAQLRVSHETRWIARRDFDADFDDILEAMDQPSTDGVNTYLVSKAAASAGIKVALSGLGGDELLGGYPSFVDLPRIRNASRASGLSPSSGKTLRKVVSPILNRLTSPKYAGLFEYGQTHAGAYLLRRGLFMPWEIPEIMDPEMAARGWEDLQTLQNLAAGIRGLGKDRQIVSTLELDWYMRNQLLRDNDWAGMAHSLEIRVPYIDLPFFRSIAKISTGARPLGKVDLALALDPPLPGAVIERSKTGFLAPVREWCDQRSVGGAKERGLRGWAKIVIQSSLAATGAAVMRPASERTLFAQSWTPQLKSAHAPADAVDAEADAARFRSIQPGIHRLKRRIQAAAMSASYQAINAVLRGSAFLLWPGRRPSAANRVCVFRIGNIGDIVCALPAIRLVRLAYPGAHLTLLSSPGRKGMPGAAEVLDGVEWIDELRIYYTDGIDTHSKRASLLREMRARRFDVWIDIPNNLTTISRQFRDMLFTRMAGARWARGWRIDTLAWAAQAQSERLRFANEVDRTINAVRRMGFANGEIDFALPRPAPVRKRIDDVMQPLILPTERLIAMAPGAKRSTNLWFPDRFAQVGQELSDRGYAILLIGGQSDAEMCAAIAAQIGSQAQSFAGELSVAESCEMLRRCRLVVCLDSGVQHLASAVGTPCLSLFSFWQMRGKWHPHGGSNTVIQKWVPCHTCLLEQCPHGNLCMREISAAEVSRAAQRFLTADVNGRQLEPAK